MDSRPFTFATGEDKTMKNLLWGIAAMTLVVVGPAQAADIVYKPIDTQKLVVQPSKVAAGLASQTINLVGQTAANSIEKNGYFKTFNNLLKKTIHLPETQAGPSPLPTPTMFSSTQYKNFNSPVMPATQSARR
jgi:hypothetical protein